MTTPMTPTRGLKTRREQYFINVVGTVPVWISCTITIITLQFFYKFVHLLLPDRFR